MVDTLSAFLTEGVCISYGLARCSILLKIHTPPVEDFGKVYHIGDVIHIYNLMCQGAGLYLLHHSLKKIVHCH